MKMSNLCEEELIIYNGHFFSKKGGKKCANQSFCKNIHFLERQLLLTKLQMVGYFSFKLFI